MRRPAKNAAAINVGNVIAFDAQVNKPAGLSVADGVVVNTAVDFVLVGAVDIVGFNVVSSSRIFRVWEKMTYWLRLSPRVRGAAMLLSSDFLRRIGGYPTGEFVDTILLQKSNRTIVAPLTVCHNQRFDFKHSVRRQISDGRFRAEIRYPFWKTLLHSVFRLRPFVLISYVFHRIPKRSES